jgi:cytochrome c-type biogenesis protein CcmH/NrfG
VSARLGTTLRRIGLAALVILALSALAKWLVFDTVLAPDESGRQRSPASATTATGS